MTYPFAHTAMTKLQWFKPLLSSIFIAVALSACATKETNADKMSPNSLMAQAKDEFSSNNFDKALVLYEKLGNRAAGTPLAQQALLEKAYTHYKNDEVPKALTTLSDFMKQYPDSPAMDYALYLRGIVNFQEQSGFLSALVRQDLADRDQNASKAAFLAFEEVTKKFPNSKYATDSKKRMNYIVNSLAQYEVNVARYYLEHDAYIAAANRAQNALANYRNVPALEEAIFVLYQSYDKLALTDLRDDAKRIMERTFPKSNYLKNGFGNKKGFFNLW